jgi:hypothetical protein
MAKYLDLDNIVPPKRTIKLGGIEYEVATLSVEQFIETIRRTEEMQKRQKKGDELSLTELVQLQLDAVKLALPSMPHDVASKLTYKQVEAILNFVRETAEADSPKGEGEGDSGKAPTAN